MAYQVRSKEQLAVMLKLIEVNDVNLTRRNLDVRHKVWQAIAQKLNQMHGAEKDADAWKRSYYTWRINTGTDYQKEIHKIISNVPDDDYFYINLTEDEDESDNDKQVKISTKSPTERQKTRLDELAYKHRQILNSTADDEPLKTQIWRNIAEELNKIPGAMKLTPKDWRQRVNMEKYRARRGRKRVKEISPAKEIKENLHTEESIEFELVGSETMGSQGVESYEPDYGSVDELIQDESEIQSTSTNTYLQHDDQSSKAGVDFDIDIDTLLNENNDENYDYDDDDVVDDDSADNDTEVEYKPQSKRIRPSPMVKSFKSSNRIVKSVEKLSNDVNDIKELLRKNTNILELMENVLQQQCKKQDETNALLKRNGQLLKVLVEYKCGKRKNLDNR